MLRYPYITHLFFNAAILDVVGINGKLATRQMLTEFVVSLSVPRYNIERVGDLTQDGLGRSWQSNCFGHYIIVSCTQRIASLHLIITPDYSIGAPARFSPQEIPITPCTSYLVVVPRGIAKLI
jgi:hypothetical protein